MTHFRAVLMGLLCLPPAALAAVAPGEPRPGCHAAAANILPVRVTKQMPPSDGAFLLTSMSAVRLNGRLCRFKDVPNEAIITKIEVDADTREILTAHFSTKK